jgi:cell division protein FtsB
MGRPGGVRGEQRLGALTERPVKPPRGASTQRVPVTLPEETAPEHWLRTLRFSGFSALMLCLLIFAVIVLAPNLRVLIEQQQNIAQLKAGVAASQQSVKDLNTDIARWSDPTYIESQARERLFFVFPGEVSYLVVGGSPATTTSDGQPISTQIQTTQVDWVHSLLVSIFTAGLTDATPAQLSPTPGPQ